MKRLLTVLLLLALPLAAQDEKKEEKKSDANPPRVQKLFILKYADPNQIANLLRVFNATVTPNSEMHALAAHASPEAMAAIEDAVKRLDVPTAAPRNIELTVYLMAGTDAETAQIEALPKELDPVVTQLKNAFTFKHYRLLDVLTLRTRTGQRAETTSSGGSIPVGSLKQSVTTQFRINSASISTDGATIRLDGMMTSSRVPMTTGSGDQFTYTSVGLNSDVDIKEGQKVVVGKLGMSPDQAMFLVLMARVAN